MLEDTFMKTDIAYAKEWTTYWLIIKNKKDDGGKG